MSRLNTFVMKCTGYDSNISLFLRISNTMKLLLRNNKYKLIDYYVLFNYSGLSPLNWPSLSMSCDILAEPMYNCSLISDSVRD